MDITDKTQILVASVLSAGNLCEAINALNLDLTDSGIFEKEKSK